MTAEIEILRPDQMQAAIDYAERLAYSAMIPDVYQGKPANILWAMEYGRTLGLSTIAVINGVNVIKGKPTASAALISALVRQAGHRMRIGFDATTMTGWAEIVRADDPEFTFRSAWDLERAVEAELCSVRGGKPFAVDSKGNSLPWKKFYPSMVKARAITEVARDACEEVLFGLHYTPQELGGDVDEDGSPIVVRQMPERPAERSRPSQPAEDQWTKPAPGGIDDAEVVPETDPAAFWETDEGKRRLTVMHALIGQKYGPMDDGRRHAGFRKFTGRAIGSAKELFPDEVERFCEALRGQPDFQPAEEPAPGPTAEPVPDDASGLTPEQERYRADLESRLLARIGAAPDVGELDAAWSAVQDNAQIGALTAAQEQGLTAAMNRREAELIGSAA